MKRIHAMKLTAKVLVAQLVAITIALTMTAWLIDWRAGVAYRGYFAQTQASQLATLANQAALQYTEGGDWQAVQDWLDQLSLNTMAAHMGRGNMGGGMGLGNMGSNNGGRAAEATVAGTFLLVDAQSGQPLAPSVSPGAVAALDATMLSAGAPVVVAGTPVALLVSLLPGQYGRAEEALLGQVQTAILLSAAISGVLALAIGALLVANVLHPLRAVESAVMAVANGDFNTRLQVQGQDEFAKLGSAVNLMAETLQAQETLRQRLVSDVAHELRTPLSVIQGNLQAILDGVYPLNNEEIQTVFDETQLLSRLVTDLHELAQAEAGRLLLQRQQLPVDGILRHLADLYMPLAEQRGIKLHVEPLAAHCEVNADPDRLQQILHNLVGNALRHTPSGKTIRISTRKEAGFTSPIDQVRFTVEDTGSGIAAADIPYVFERFYRSETNRPRPADHATGAGLGLAIAKALVVAHGGEIGVNATIPHGATFWFTLPIHSAR